MTGQLKSRNPALINLTLSYHKIESKHAN